MFNISMKDYVKYHHLYPDELKEIAETYNKIETYLDNDIFMSMNQHLRLFPLLNSWRVEICYAWDLCRRSMVCSTSTFEERIKHKFKSNRITENRVMQEGLVEYYLENAMYRLFAALDKCAYVVNILFSLHIQERRISFISANSILSEQYASHSIAQLFITFSNGQALNRAREIRNGITHRMHPAAPSYYLDEIIIDLTGSPKADPRMKSIKFIAPIRSEPSLTIRDFVDLAKSFYDAVTIFLNNLFTMVIDELQLRLNQEELEFGGGSINLRNLK